MRPVRLARLLALVPLVAVATGLTALPASAATTPASVAAALRSNPVYVEPDAEAAGQVDAAAVRSQLASSSRRIYVAVLPARAGQALGSPTAVAVAVSKDLGTGQVLVALVGSDLVAVAAPGTGLAAGQAQSLVGGASGSPTQRLVAAVQALQQAPVSAAGPAAAGDTASSGSGLLAWVLVALALLAMGGGGLFYLRTRRRRRQELDGQRADVESLYNRLGSDVSTLAPGDDPVARQALADASERYTATGALLSTADTPGELSAARRTVVEGLTAARTARQKLGLDPGPEIPPPPGTGPQLTAPQTVRVGDQEFEGSPTYQPGRGHYYGGGYYNGQLVPGGWYAFPFWETMLMTSVLTGGFGGFGGFGGGGYERGYEEGVEDSQNPGGGGGDWGGGGWGGGGGDWGGGGGDWGGGGGDGGSW